MCGGVVVLSTTAPATVEEDTVEEDMDVGGYTGTVRDEL
jgi:hypothetical protein